MTSTVIPKIQHPKMGVLISGRGSNLMAIVAAKLPLEIALVISNRADALGLAFCKQHQIPCLVIDHNDYSTREAFDRAMIDALDKVGVKLVVLAGFMRILSVQFVQHYSGRLLNIHPSLLPQYKGLHTHARAIEAKETWHGVSVHSVTAQLDGGPVIAQIQLAINQHDTAETLAARLLPAEHQLYPQVLRWWAEQRLILSSHSITFDGLALAAPIRFHLEA